MKHALIFFFIFFSQFTSFGQKQGQAKIDSLILVLDKSVADTNRVILLNDLSYSLSNINPDKGLVYAEEALKLSEQLLYYNGKAQAFSNYGLNLTSKGDYSRALENHFKALSIQEKLGNKQNVAVCYSNIGVVYNNQPNLDKAQEYYLKALEAFKELDFDKGFATTSGNLGLLFYAKEEYENALNYFNEALLYAQKNSDTASMAACIGNMGNVYLAQKKYDKALEFDLMALHFNEKVGDVVGSGIGMGNVGEVYYKIATESNNGILDSLFKGDEKKAIELAKSYLIRSLEIFRQIGFLNGIQEVNKYLINVYEKTGDYKRALAAAREHISIKDSIFNEESSNRIAALEARRIEELKQKEIEIQKLQIQKVEKDQWFLIAALIALSIIICILYFLFRDKKISNEKLEKTLADLKATQQQLVVQEKLASLGALTAGVAHEIQNPLNFVNNFSELSAELIDEFEQENDENGRKEILQDIKSNLFKIGQHGKRADAIVKNMLLHARTDSGTKQLTDINKLCDEAVGFSFHASQARYKNFSCNIHKKFDDNMQPISLVPGDISRVILNMLTNAFYSMHMKKSEPGNGEYLPELTISTFKASEKIIISITDNGGGIPDSVKKKLFEPFFTTKPANEGTGLGLSISYDIIKAHGGEIKLDTANGTTFSIELPYSK